MGAAFGVAQGVANGQTVSLNLWDTAGQEECRSAAVAVTVFDLASPASFDAVGRCDVVGRCGAPEPRLVVANKLDLRARRAVSEARIEDLVGRPQCGYFADSALERPMGLQSRC
jgi:GTPase SAR1 family protein